MSMNTASAGTITLSVDEAHSLGERAIQRIGYSAEEARVITPILIDAALCGYASHGLPRIITMAEHPRTQQPRRPVRIVHETPCSALVDGGNYIGFYAVHRAAEIAIEKARASRFALVGVHDSFISGRSAYYLEKIARAGFAGMMTACSAPVVVPLGGAKPALGTNPIAFGLPGEPNPYLFDMSTAATNHGDVLMAKRLGENLPSGLAVDERGLPTTDPVAALAGGILTFGGHRGHGLSVTIQALGLLAGAALPRGQVQDFAFLFVVFDPGLLVPPEQFKQQLAELLGRIRSTPTQLGIDEVRIPSERAFAEREKRRRTGIVLERVLYDRLNSL
ncbi:MAG TPA: Ldh family oxidoreductase [Burkholderiales bacterium]|nr:Ldh family oxidoreductase [Burkholderiales bacterium]